MVLGITASYMVLEAVGGFLSNSLSLLADAGHMLADVAALVIALIAFVLSARPPSFQATFGYYRAEIIGALFNGVALLFISFLIAKAAITRFFFPQEATVDSHLMILIAVGGLLVNIVGLLLLRHERATNINVRGAFLHLISDTLGSIAAVLSGLLIYFFGWNFFDSISSLVIATLVSISAVKLVLETLWVLMEHTPAHIDAREVNHALLLVPDTVKIHKLHIWTITSGREALSVHVVAKKDADHRRLLQQLENVLKQKFGITHTTIQLESEDQSHPAA